jgi:hypothetical protein
LEPHLARLARRLQRSLVRSGPERSLAGLGDRLDAIEQRFGTALGRVAQRADLDGLKSIETHVMELGAQLDRARDRLEQIGAVDDEVCALARRFDEAGERRATALEKLLRDCIAEWREGEQRTASALQSLEEAIGRLGDSVDAMEASKPAPDLTMPALAATPDLAASGAIVGSLSQPHELAQPAHLYHAMLDAADYAPKSARGAGPAADEPARTAQVHESSTRRVAAVEWSAPTVDSDLAEPEGANLGIGNWEIAALRARLRQAPDASLGDAHADTATGAERPAPDSFRRASLGLLLMAGAVLASSTYMLYQAVVAPLPSAAPGGPDPGAQAVGGKPELTGDRRHGYREG